MSCCVLSFDGNHDHIYVCFFHSYVCQFCRLYHHYLGLFFICTLYNVSHFHHFHYLFYFIVQYLYVLYFLFISSTFHLFSTNSQLCIGFFHLSSSLPLFYSSTPIDSPIVFHFSSRCLTFFYLFVTQVSEKYTRITLHLRHSPKVVG